LVSVSRDGTVRLWDTAAARQLRRLAEEDGEDAPARVALCPGGRTLATGRWDDETITLWDLETGRAVRRLTHPQAGVAALGRRPAPADAGGGQRRLVVGRGRRPVAPHLGGAAPLPQPSAGRPVPGRQGCGLAGEVARRFPLGHRDGEPPAHARPAGRTRR